MVRYSSHFQRRYNTMKQEHSLSVSELHYRKMTQTPVARLIIQLGMPTTVSMLITSIYNMADTYFVGTLGESAQAATGILFALQSVIQGIAFMLGQGSGSVVAKALPKQDTEEASGYISTAFFSGATVGCVILALGLLFLTPLMNLLGSTATILAYAKDYGMWVLIACPFMICSLILNNNLRFEGKAFYAMFGLTTGGILNIFGDYLLVSVYDFGISGAGFSTAVSQMISFTILLIMYLTKAQGKIRLSCISRRAKVYLTIMSVGLPSLIRQCLTAISGSLLNNLTKPFEDAAIAAMSVVNRYSMFVMCVGLGIGQGFQPVAAFNYEAGEKKRVRRGLLFTMCFSTVFVSIMSVLTFFYAEKIILLFQDAQTVVTIGAEALRYAAFGLMFMPLTIPINMLYQSIRKAGIASFLSTLRSGALLMPTLLIGVPLLGLKGIQIAQPLADCLTGLISIPFIIRYLRTDK